MDFRESYYQFLQKIFWLSSSFLKFFLCHGRNYRRKAFWKDQSAKVFLLNHSNLRNTLKAISNNLLWWLSYKVLPYLQLEMGVLVPSFHTWHNLMTRYLILAHKAHLSKLQDLHNKECRSGFDKDPFLKFWKRSYPLVLLFHLSIKTHLHSKLKELNTFRSLCSIFLSCRFFKPLTICIKSDQTSGSEKV